MNENKDQNFWGTGEPSPQNPPHQSDHVYPPRPSVRDFQQQQQQPPPKPGSQYSPNSGWQQPRPEEKYTWNFEDYDRFDRARRTGQKKGNRGMVVFTVLLLSVLSLGLVGLAGYSIYSALPDSHPSQAPQPQPETDAPIANEPEQQLQIAQNPREEAILGADGITSGTISIPEVCETVLPSVVGVVQYANGQYFESSGYGSGIVMSEDGYIITNAHVVAGGTGFKVQFTDGDAYDAIMVGYDTVTDLAVLKIDAQGLTPAVFGDSNALRVGESVVAIGNPGGDVLASSVTQGIISAVNRQVQTSNYRMTYIQTDAAINPGNSGGPLVNAYGQVIGINSAKVAATGYEGIGFAIPVATAKPVIDDIIQNGRVTGRLMLGITCRVVDEIDARNASIPMGLLIESVDPASDLSTAGVQRNDILTHIDGERVYTLSDVRDILDQHQMGDVVTLTFFRRVGVSDQAYDVDTRLLESQ